MEAPSPPHSPTPPDECDDLAPLSAHGGEAGPRLVTVLWTWTPSVKIIFLLNLEELQEVLMRRSIPPALTHAWLQAGGKSPHCYSVYFYPPFSSAAALLYLFFSADSQEKRLTEILPQTECRSTLSSTSKSGLLFHSPFICPYK